MFKKDKGLFLVHYNGYYMSSTDYKNVNSLTLDSNIKEATVFDNLRSATKWAKRIRGDVLFYNHNRTERHHYNDLSVNQDFDDDEVHP